jgi:proteasome lid subunit RPN8/RPN11
MIKVPEKIIEVIVKQSLHEFPNEACGYLAGNNFEVKKIFSMTNIDKSPEHFSFDPKEQFRVVKEARRSGLDLISVYHSHPETPARMSKEDIRLAMDTDKIYIIHSLAENKTRAYKIVDNEILEEKIEVIK